MQATLTYLLLFAVLACITASTPAPGARKHAGAVPVRLVRTASGWTLTRSGTPYAIRGAGGDGSLKLLKACGGDSIRTWGADNAQPLLDRAGRLGLTVTVGIWLGQEQQGFSYADKAAVAAQLQQVRRDVLQYRNDPNLLIWGIGNEVGHGDDAPAWQAIEDAAKLVKQLDPNHPTMTVVAEIGGDTVQSVQQYCPDIDILGINSYGGAPTIADRYRAAGGTKPFVLTEFGPMGWWEVARNSWGALQEATSTEKAAHYRESWHNAVAGNPMCLGGYAFLWGHKDEGTPTWFGMLLPDGSRLEAVDEMQEIWTGAATAHPCPEIRSLTVDGSPSMAPGAELQARLSAVAPSGGGLGAEWQLWHDGANGKPVDGTTPVVRSSVDGAAVHMPDAPGNYRLYVTVRDSFGGAATANVPLRVIGAR